MYLNLSCVWIEVPWDTHSYTVTHVTLLYDLSSVATEVPCDTFILSDTIDSLVWAAVLPFIHLFWISPKKIGYKLFVGYPK